MPPQWLDPDERAAWLTLIRIAAKLPATLDAQLMRDAGLSFFEYSVMAMLSEQPDRTLRMSELAAVTNASLSRLSHAATRLEGQGLLTREADPHDGRFTRATLTEDGMRTVVQTAPAHVAAVRELVIDVVTPGQLRQLRVANDRILARIDPDGTTEPSTPTAT